MARLFLGLAAGVAAADNFAPEATAPVEAIQVILGVTEGILSDQPHLTTCIGNGLGAVLEAKTALVDVKNAIVDKNLLEVADALDAMADTLRMIPQIMEPCGATKDDVAAVHAALKEIAGFRDLLKKMRKHLVLNHKKIIGDAVAAEHALQEKQYEEFGKHVGMALHRLALGKFHDDLFSESDEEIKPALEIVYGVTVGMLSDQRHLPTCIANGLATGDDAKASLVGLKNAVVDKNVIELADALDAMATTLRDIPATLAPCGATKDDVSAILAALKEIDGFKDFLKKSKRHIILNSKGLIADVVAAEKSLLGKDYEDFGEHVGMALHKVAFGRFHDGDVVV